ncbi:MAG: intradiol ring-cleavage dioxygenase [Actinomycetota bacterium]|nr:intradiol ring-cleavage dioxygenase [Actinomycetota bacterium]
MSLPEPVSAEISELLARTNLCRSWAEQEEGPYYRDLEPVRRDITEDRPGAQLLLGIRLASDDGGALPGVAVEIWHCDALGRYSGFPPPDPHVVVTAATAPRAEYLPGETFLRGRQFTDAAGTVEFHTIYPGWYPGRTVHIHAIARTASETFTGQLYFPDPISDEVLATDPYRDRPGRDTTNDTDTIFATGGAPAVVDLARFASGYRAVICLVLPSSADLR